MIIKHRYDTIDTTSKEITLLSTLINASQTEGNNSFTNFSVQQKYHTNIYLWYHVFSIKCNYLTIKYSTMLNIVPSN